jgi:hypothetical protein
VVKAGQILLWVKGIVNVNVCSCLDRLSMENRSVEGKVPCYNGEKVHP